MVFWLTVILLLVEMLCFSPVIMSGRLINLFLVNYCCIMLILWLARSTHFASLLQIKVHIANFTV